jgi:hypothetical protein
MASEYSRDRSRLIRYAQSRATRLGFHAAGPPPFGMRRVMVTRTGDFVRDLHRGEWKALANHRTRLVPGDPAAVETIRRIFDLYDREGQSPAAIVASLNEEGASGPSGGRWYQGAVLGVLTNSVYAGSGHYRPRRRGLNDPLTDERSADLRVENAAGHVGIVESTVFRRAQEQLARSIWRRSNAELSHDARRGFEAHGCVEERMLKVMPGHCSWDTYQARFARGIDEALETAYVEVVAERTARIGELLRTDVGADEKDGVWALSTGEARE